MTTTTSALPTTARGLLSACLEAFLGRRALHQIRTSMDRRAFERLIADQISGATSEARPLSVQMPSDVAVEASVLVRDCGRWLVCVLRLDLDETTGWRCSDFQVLR